MSYPYIGEIRLFAGSFAPDGWMFCDGQILPIAAHSALFAVIGVAYGGNGQTTFALPNLNGRFPMGAGAGPGRTARPRGTATGIEQLTLLPTEIPAHGHTVPFAGTGRATDGDPQQSSFAVAEVEPYGPAVPGNELPLVGPAGGGMPHNNLSPYLGLSFIIATEGIYPGSWP